MRRLAVFAQTPAARRARTHLSPALPAEIADALHRAVLRDVLEAAAASRAEQQHLFWSEPPDEATAALAPSGFGSALQQGEDSGERLANAFATLLESPGDHAVIVRADSPALDAEQIDRAFHGLETHDLVLGPTRGGDDVLIGLARPVPAILEGVPWGAADAHEHILLRARAAPLRVRSLEPVDPLESAADLARLVAEWAVSPPARPVRTLAALRECGLLP
jgi:glycosyltransferase A (GT-A) superfamily protein (DUF2064 family)